MILGVGTDLISIKRIEDLMLEFKEKFSAKVFSEYEIAQAKKTFSAAFFAKRFAAKEAFAKALGTGIGRGVNFKDIEIFNDDLGKPKIRLINGKESFLQTHFGCKNIAIHLSISDEKTFANAIVIIEKIS